MIKRLGILPALALAGCVSMPAIKQPAPELPAAWPESLPASSATAAEGKAAGEIMPQAMTQAWWRIFNDPQLDRLMEEALAGSQDLKLAAARVLEAEANLRSTGAALLPEVDATATASRNRRSLQTSPLLPAGTPTHYNNFGAGLQASYEVDLWGRIRASTDSARADLLATRYAGEVVRQTLTQNVAQAWFNLNALGLRERLTRETLANRVDAARLTERRFEVGTVSEFEVRQAQAEAAALESQLAQIDQQARLQENALGVLLGRSPRALVQLRIQAEDLKALAPPPEIPAGLPSELLQRRPDLRQAEASLASTQASIREARAALFPSLTLTGNLGSASASLSDLFSGPSMAWGLGANLAQSLFNGGRTEAAIQARSARQDQALKTLMGEAAYNQALAAYESTARQAFREVLDALVAHRQTREIWAAEGKRVEALARATQLAESRFNAGAASQLDVLDAQRNLYQAQQNAIDASRARLSAAASLVKALGGGWQDQPQTDRSR